MIIFPIINNFMTKSLITKIFIPLTTKDKKERTMLVKKTDGAILKCNIHFFSKVAVVITYAQHCDKILNKWSLQMCDL